MVAAEHLQCFAGGTHTTLLCVFDALADTLKCIGLRGDVEQALIGFGILHDRFCLSIDGKNQRFLRFLEMFHEFPTIAAERRHRLNVFFDVKHNDLALHSTLKGVKPSCGGLANDYRVARRPCGRPALSELGDGQVIFLRRDSAHSNEQKPMTLSLNKFLHRFLLHTLPQGFVRIRNFGFLASRKRASLLPLCFQLLGSEQQPQANNTPLPPKTVPILGAALNAVRMGIPQQIAAQSEKPKTSGFDITIDKHAQQILESGRQIFRYDTFGSEAFWGDALQLHKAIAGEKNGGVGGGVSPKIGSVSRPQGGPGCFA
jgi:hypothetical protein